MPAELDEMHRQIMQMEIEEAALKKEEDKLSKERLACCQQGAGRAARPVQQHEGAVGQREERRSTSVQELREEIEDTNAEIEQGRARL